MSSRPPSAEAESAENTTPTSPVILTAADAVLGDDVDSELVEVFFRQSHEMGDNDAYEDEEGEEDGEGEAGGVEGGDLPDAVGSDVRAPATEPVTYEAIHHRDQAGDAHNTSGVSSPKSRMQSAGSQTDERPDSDNDENEQQQQQQQQQAMNPSQGVQADADVDVPMLAANDDDVNADAEAAAAAAAAAEAEEEEREENKAEETKAMQIETSPSPTVAAAAAPVAPVIVMQAVAGTVVVHTTLLPMGARTTLTLPVSRSVKTKANGSLNSAVTEPGEGCWLLSARGLFEAMATRLCVHPQSFHVRRNGERVRFSHTILLDVDKTTATSAPSGGVATSEDQVDDASRPLVYAMAEPLWISVSFPDPAALQRDNDYVEEEGKNDEESALGQQQAQGTGVVGPHVPTHLALLYAGELLERCVHVRKTKPQLLPQTLVEGRRQGLSFDDMIQQSYRYDRGVAGDEDVTTVVAIVRAADFHRKPFIGGYRVKEDASRLLLHASTQLFMKDLNYSPFPEKRVRVEDMCSRQTQTYGTSRSCQTAREGCVQTPSSTDCGHIVLDDSRDYVVVARPYFSAAQLHELRVAKIILLQKLYRQWKARQIRRGLEEEDAEKQQRAEERQRTEEAAQRARENHDHMRRADPRTAADFDRLREEVVRWRAAEATRLAEDRTLTNAEKQCALLAVTKEEVRMLQELEHRRRLTLLERKDDQFSAQLARTAADKIWGASGIAVKTPETVRAGELRDLYAGVTNPHNMTTEERLDVLLHVKWTVKEFAAAAVSAELCQLIDREADLLHRGRTEASLTGLRKRIELLFRQFIEDPTYNPGMAPFTTTAVGRTKVRELGLEERLATAAATGDRGSTNGPNRHSSRRKNDIVDLANTKDANGSPYGGHAAANCASCSLQLRTALIVNARRRRATEKVAAAAAATHSSGSNGHAEEGEGEGEGETEPHAQTAEVGRAGGPFNSSATVGKREGGGGQGSGIQGGHAGDMPAAPFSSSSATATV